MISMQSSTLKLAIEKDMTPEAALKLGKAVGIVYKSVTVGMGAEPYYKMICDAIISGLLSVGSEVKYAGIAPTPAITMASKDSECTLVVGETNAHSIANMINLYNPDGSSFNDEQLRHLLMTSEEDYVYPDYKSIEVIRPCDSIIEKYSKIISKKYSDVEGSVIIDCECGTTSLCAPQILTSSGADVIGINAQINTKNNPNYCGNNVLNLGDMVQTSIGSIGISLNSSGTRMTLVDEGGSTVDGDDLIALSVIHLNPSVIVVPMETSYVVDDAFWDVGNPENVSNIDRKIIRTKNDLSYITSAIKENNADYGVMSDGLFIFPDTTLCPDAIHSALLFTKLSGENNLKDLRSMFHEYIQLSYSIHYGGSREIFEKKFDDALENLDTKNIIRIDGWRVDMAHGWFMVYFDEDNPEYIKVLAESDDKMYVNSMIELVKTLIIKCIN